MASLELNPVSGKYHIRFRYAGRSFKRSLKTGEHKDAQAALFRLEETLGLVERGILDVPENADPTTFLLSNGRTKTTRQANNLISLSDLFTHYLNTLPRQAKEESTLQTEKIHIKHFRRYLPVSKPAVSITTADVQKYVNKQLKRKVNGRRISPGTAKRQVDTLRGIYNWANKMELFEKPSPTSGLVYPKTDEQLPFMTREEIERILDRGGMNDQEIKRHWDSLYLTIPEVNEVLTHIEKSPRYPFIYPMFAFIAYTGARRSEMMRSRIDDFDLEQGTVMVRERKRSRKKSTTFRRVNMPSKLVDIMQSWFEDHPGGQHAFCWDFGVVKNDWQKGLTSDQARIQFEKSLKDSEWSVIKGYHVFRHSYASNLAAAGVDQRIIDKHMGHQTEEMRKRYQHLRPAICRDAVEVLVGPK